MTVADDLAALPCGILDPLGGVLEGRLDRLDDLFPEGGIVAAGLDPQLGRLGDDIRGGAGMDDADIARPPLPLLLDQAVPAVLDEVGDGQARDRDR